MRVLTEVGVLRPSGDEQTRAAFLLANDLAMILLRRQIESAIGDDPLERRGLARWSAEVMDVYANGVFTSSDPASNATTPRRGARR